MRAVGIGERRAEISEMDEARESRHGRGSSRLFKQRQTGLDGDGSYCGVVGIKLGKKEKLRRVSSVSRISLSNEMDQLSNNTKRIKLPKKFFYDCNPVDHISVPRKLRSAMKKRYHKSVSPASQNSTKSSCSLELQAKNNRKKLKENDNEAIPGSITKDEEEVAETLYSLAGMFAENAKVEKSNEINEMAGPKSPALLVLKEGAKNIREMSSTEASSLEASAGGSVKIQTSEAITCCKSQDSKELMERHNVDLPKEPLSDSTVSIIPAELSLRMGSGQLKTDEIPKIGRTPEIGEGLVAAFGSRGEDKTTFNECRNSGLASTVSPSVTLPAWLGNATRSSHPCSSEKIGVTKNKSEVAADENKLWKRCTAHVYICHLIKVLQVPERKEEELPKPTIIQIKPDEQSNQGALMRNGSAADNSSNEVRNAVLLHKRLVQDHQQQASSPSALFHSSHKRTFDILSISAGSCGIEASCNIVDRSINKLEPSTTFHASAPYLHSAARKHPLIPLHLPQNCFSSFSDHLPAAASEQVPIQLPPYFGNAIYDPTHLDPSCFPKQPLTHMWGNSQLIAPRFNWQNGKHEPPGFAQVMMPPHTGSSLEMLGSKYATGNLLEVLGPKYTHQISAQQQQQPIPIASVLPLNRAKRQFNCLPPHLEENGAGLFHLDSSSTLRLLCNEHL